MTKAIFPSIRKSIALLQQVRQAIQAIIYWNRSDGTDGAGAKTEGEFKPWAVTSWFIDRARRTDLETRVRGRIRRRAAGKQSQGPPRPVVADTIQGVQSPKYLLGFTVRKLPLGKARC